MNPKLIPPRVAIVTGGIGGLGTEICRHLARDGRQVVALDLAARTERVAAFREELAEFGDAVDFAPLDVSDFEDCRQALAQVESRHGSVDIVVNAAGITRDASLRKMSPQQWHELMRVNLDGTFYVCRAAQRHLRHDGSIVLLTSLAAQRGSYAHAAYAASKGAVQSFTRSLALELAPQIRVNAVAPGIIATSMTHDLIGQKGAQLLESTPLRRFGTAEEIAGTIAFLCSPLAAFVTGEVMQVNGGIYIA